MNGTFRSELNSRLESFRVWAASRSFSGCRLVHYCGADLVGAKDVPSPEVVVQIEELICEGFFVDWSDNNDRLYLRVWEFGGPEPDWAHVFAEKSLLGFA
jgi:hypothetical protein